jgi:hypothetical protein
MNITKTLGLLAPAALALATSAHAQLPVEQIRLGTPSYAGTGCPLGSTSATLSPDGQSLSILFGAFQAEAGGSTGRTIDRKACNIAIPVGVPQGYTVSVIKIDYRGFDSLPLSASATFDAEYFFAGQNGPAYHKSFNGAEDGNFTLNNQLVAQSAVWSPCGADVNLRTNTNISVVTNQNNEQAMLSIDSADITSGVVYQLQWQRCNGGPVPTPYPQPTPYNPYPTPYPTPYNPYPTPYPQPTPILYPQPTFGPCVINSYNDPRGYMGYSVTDGSGRVIGTTAQYPQAMNIAQSAQQQRMCSGIVNAAQGQGPYNPNPYNPNPYNPNPTPVYGSPVGHGYGQNFCNVMQGGNAYGQQFFRVTDRAGRIIYNASSYQDAQRVQQTDQRCFQ